MKKIIFLLTLFLTFALHQTAQALVIWGYNNTAADQKKYRHLTPSNVNGCLQIARNTDATFILRNELNYLSGIGFRTSGNATCTWSMDHVTITLITPRHALVAVHWGIWNGVNRFSFVGTDGQIYSANTVPGVTVLSSPIQTTDIGLIEMDRDLPPQVIPLHVLSAQRQAALLTQQTPTYVYGNINTQMSIDSFLNAGDAAYKGIGTNATYPLPNPNTIFAQHVYVPLFKDPPTPGSTNWSDYWWTQYAPLPPVGTAFPRYWDSGAPTMIKAPDASGRTRLYYLGNHKDYTIDNNIAGAYDDLSARIAAYNTAHRTRYTLNALDKVGLKAKIRQLQTDLPLKNHLHVAPTTMDVLHADGP